MRQLGEHRLRELQTIDSCADMEYIDASEIMAMAQELLALRANILRYQTAALNANSTRFYAEYAKLTPTPAPGAQGGTK
jgi:hypothetical protein